MEPREDKICRICGKDVVNPSARLYDDSVAIQCRVCGDYQIVPDAYWALSAQSAEQKRYLLSGKARMAKILTGTVHRFSVEDVGAMLKLRLRDKTFSESALSVVRWIAANGSPGTLLDVEPDRDYPTGFCRDGAGFAYLIEELRALNYIASTHRVAIGKAMLTGAGWRWLEGQITEGVGQQAFIAMSFAPEMKSVEDAIRAGVEAAGYEPVLVKDREFEDGIVDKIFAEIRRSHFVIADFTQNKAGVYYEAGFALGLGLRVIGACEKSQLDPAEVSKRLHFDVRHLNMIDWTEDHMAGLTERVERRIRGTFGAGPKKAPAG